MIEWIPKPRFSTWNPVVQANNAESALVGITGVMPGPYPWTILNPLTENCIYGTAGDKYNTASQCLNSGALFYFSALPAAKAAGICANACGNNSTWMEGTAFNYDKLFQLAQFANNKFPKKDLSFTDDFVAYSRNWVIGPATPPKPSWIPSWAWPSLPVIDDSWTRVRNHSLSNEFYAPHTPLIFRLDKYGPGCGAGFDPTKYGGQKSYEYLLNTAPNCGPHNFCGEYEGGRDWSGVNRLLEPLKRDGSTNYSVNTQNPCGYNASFNGLDYMLLFNLYGLVETSNYLKKMINPFYTENFNTNYPDGSNIGSHTYKLTLNYLEYISAINKVNATGHLTIRCAKTVDLYPGFEAKSGSYFDAFIQDYSCNSFVDVPNAQSTPFHYAMLQTNDPNFVSTFPTPIEYSPDNTEHNNLRQLHVNDSADRMADKYYSPEQEQAYANELKKSIYESGDSSQIRLMESLFAQSNTGTEGDDFIHISPNPSKGSFVIDFFHEGYFSIQIADFTGNVFYKTNTEKISKLQIDLGNIAAGNYVIKIVSSISAYTKKLTIIK